MSKKIIKIAVFSLIIGLFSSGDYDRKIHAQVNEEYEISDELAIGYAGTQWYIIGNEDGGVESEANALTLFELGDVYYPGAGFAQPYIISNNKYSISQVHSRLTSIYMSLKDTNEFKWIIPRTLENGGDTHAVNPDGVAGDRVEDVGMWLLSYSEAESVSQQVRKHTGTAGMNGYWLRSPGGSSTNPSLINTDGTLNPIGIDAYNHREIRPAIKLDLTSVLFTSDTEGGKTSAVGNITSASTDGVIKFTMVDPYDASTNDEGQKTLDFLVMSSTNGSSNISILYEGASTGNRQYISCILVDSTGTTKYYGKLADCEENANGTLTLPLAGIENGTYTLKLFSEQINGDNYTDFASTPIESTITINQEKGIVEGDIVDDTKPKVINVEPTGMEVTTDVNELSITFDKTMDTGTINRVLGNVQLIRNDGGVVPSLILKEWSEDKKTVNYKFIDGDTLEEGVEYTILVSLFQDDIGNVMEKEEFTFATDCTLVLEAIQNTTVQSGKDFKWSPNVTYTGQRSLQFEVTGLPEGLSFDKNTGEISGVLKVIGEYSIVVKVSDGVKEDIKTFSLEVIAASTGNEIEPPKETDKTDVNGDTSQIDGKDVANDTTSQTIHEEIVAGDTSQAGLWQVIMLFAIILSFGVVYKKKN